MVSVVNRLVLIVVHWFINELMSWNNKQFLIYLIIPISNLRPFKSYEKTAIYRSVYLKLSKFSKLTHFMELKPHSKNQQNSKLVKELLLLLKQPCMTYASMSIVWLLFSSSALSLSKNSILIYFGQLLFVVSRFTRNGGLQNHFCQQMQKAFVSWLHPTQLLLLHAPSLSSVHWLTQ